MKYNIIILAGGFGTRLKELGESTPKGLLKTRGSTLIGQLCEAIKALSEVNQIVLITNARFYNHYQAWCDQSGQPSNTQILSDGATSPDLRLGALGDLELAAQHVDYHYPTLVLPSDTYFTFSLETLTKLYEQYQTLVTAVFEAEREQIANRLGCAELEGEQIIGFEEKPAEPKSNWACAPFYIYSPELLAKLKDYRMSGGSMDAPSHIIPWMLNQGISVYAAKVPTAIDVATQTDVDVIANR